MDGNAQSAPSAQPVQSTQPEQQSFASGRPGKKAIILLAIVVGLLLFVPLMLIFVKGASPQTEDTATNTTDSTSVTTTSSNKSVIPFVKSKPKATPVPTPYFQWDTYIDTKFSMVYPKTWIIKQSRETEGKTVTFKPPTIGEKEYIPSLMVTIRPNGAHPWLVETEDFYRTSLKFQDDKTTVVDIPATKLAGTFPANGGKSPEQSVHIYFVKDNESYLLKYQYPGSRYNSEYERLFTSMIQNFKFR